MVSPKLGFEEWSSTECPSIALAIIVLPVAMASFLTLTLTPDADSCLLTFGRCLDGSGSVQSTASVLKYYETAAFAHFIFRWIKSTQMVTEHR